MKRIASKTKIVAHTHSFTTVQRSLPGVTCAGGEMRRKSECHDAKTVQGLGFCFRFDLVSPFSTRTRDAMGHARERGEGLAHLVVVGD
jgi:hypothetical protein